MTKKDREPQVQFIANPLNRPGKSLRPAVDLKEKRRQASPGLTKNRDKLSEGGEEERFERRELGLKMKN